jgi:hypothetical protein
LHLGIEGDVGAMKNLCAWTLALVVAAAANYAHAAIGGSCIHIVHLGNEDKPMPTMTICLADRPTARMTSSPFGWSFGVRRSEFAPLTERLRMQITRQLAGEPDDHAYGTFELRWKLAAGSGSYRLAAADAPGFIADLAAIASSGNNRQLAEQLATLSRRVPQALSH